MPLCNLHSLHPFWYAYKPIKKEKEIKKEGRERKKGRENMRKKGREEKRRERREEKRKKGRLIPKLTTHGIMGKTNRWIESWLTDRRQLVYKWSGIRLAKSY